MTDKPMTIDKKEDLIKKIFSLETEMLIRCGDGTGEIHSHSINCRCAELQKEQEKLRKKYMEL